ncbi:MAG: hypothetical protein KA146_10530 [Leptospiraceae bacterium]|nr:hypothetical protein [Leptospiraceae bacterium]
MKKQLGNQAIHNCLEKSFLPLVRVYLEVDMSKESEESNAKFSITLKPELNKALEEEVNRKDRKKNFIVNLLETFP